MSKKLKKKKKNTHKTQNLFSLVAFFSHIFFHTYGDLPNKMKGQSYIQIRYKKEAGSPF